MCTSFTLGIVQDVPCRGNVKHTLEMMEKYIIEAATRDVSLLVFPELFITGYLPRYWERHPTPEDEQEWHRRMHVVCKQVGVSVIYGHPAYCVDNATLDLVQNPEWHVPFYNAATFIGPEGIVGTYAKTHLFGNEFEVFSAGDGFPVWDTVFGKLAVQICYDLEFPECARLVALAEADLLIYLANNMIPFGVFHHCYTMARAMENNLFVASINRVGAEGDLNFCGQSCVAHPNGQYLLSVDDEKGLYMCMINHADRLFLHKDLHYFAHRRPELYGGLTT